MAFRAKLMDRGRPVKRGVDGQPVARARASSPPSAIAARNDTVVPPGLWSLINRSKQQAPILKTPSMLGPNRALMPPAPLTHEVIKQGSLHILQVQSTNSTGADAPPVSVCVLNNMVLFEWISTSEISTRLTGIVKVQGQPDRVLFRTIVKPYTIISFNEINRTSKSVRSLADIKKPAGTFLMIPVAAPTSGGLAAQVMSSYTGRKVAVFPEARAMRLLPA